MPSSSQNKQPGWIKPCKNNKSPTGINALNTLIQALEKQQAELRKHIEKLKELQDASNR